MQGWGESMSYTGLQPCDSRGAPTAPRLSTHLSLPSPAFSGPLSGLLLWGTNLPDQVPPSHPSTWTRPCWWVGTDHRTLGCAAEAAQTQAHPDPGPGDWSTRGHLHRGLTH